MDTTVRIQIDTKLLRRQRNTLIALCESGTLTPEQNEHLDGLINRDGRPHCQWTPIVINLITRYNVFINGSNQP